VEKYAKRSGHSINSFASILDTRLAISVLGGALP